MVEAVTTQQAAGDVSSNSSSKASSDGVHAGAATARGITLRSTAARVRVNSAQRRLRRVTAVWACALSQLLRCVTRDACTATAAAAAAVCAKPQQQQQQQRSHHHHHHHPSRWYRCVRGGASNTISPAAFPMISSLSPS